MTVIGRAAFAVLVAGITATAAVSAQAVSAQAARAVAAAPSSVGTVAVSASSSNQLGCLPPEAGAIEPDGNLNHVFLNGANLTGPFYRDYVSTLQSVTALGPTTYEFVGSTNYFRTFTMRGGALTFDTTSYPNFGAFRHVSRSIAGNFGAVAKIVDASDRFPAYSKGGYLYTLNVKYGTLIRYKVTEATFGAPSVSWAGSRTGYSSFRSLALAYRYRDGYAGAADVLIGTTFEGRLTLITIPVAGAFTPQLTQIRASTWTFDDLVVSGCSNNTNYALIAIRSGTDRAYLYRLDNLAVPSRVIRSYGAIAAPWTPAHSSGFWGHGAYPRHF
jgi:hypothetical protein